MFHEMEFVYREIFKGRNQEILSGGSFAVNHRNEGGYVVGRLGEAGKKMG